MKNKNKYTMIKYRNLKKNIMKKTNLQRNKKKFLNQYKIIII